MRPVYRRCSLPNAYMLMQNRQTDPNPPPEKPTRTKTKNETKHRTGNRATKKKKKTQVRGKAWVKEKMKRYGSKSESASRKKSHKGKPKPHTGFGFPQRLRERERERKTEKRKRRRRTSQQPKRKRGQTNNNPKKGQVLKGTEPNNISTPETKNTSQTNQTYIPKEPDKKPRTNQTESQRSVTAGWRGPWAALHFWGVTPGDRSTEGYKYPPTAGTAPGGAKANNYPNTRLRPQKLCPSTWPFLQWHTRPHKTKQTQDDSRTGMEPTLECATNQYTCQTHSSARTFSGGPDADGAGHRPPTPEPGARRTHTHTPRIAIASNFPSHLEIAMWPCLRHRAIRDSLGFRNSNCNHRSQKSRDVGALRH